MSYKENIGFSDKLSEIKFLQLIEDSSVLFESFQHLQQENENLKKKCELSQKQVQIFESEITDLKSQVRFRTLCNIIRSYLTLKIVENCSDGFINTNVRLQNTALRGEFNGQKIKNDEQLEQIKRIENDKNVLTNQLNQNSLTTKISEETQRRRQREIDELLVSHQEYQRARDLSSQLTNEVEQLKNMVSSKT